MGSVGSKTKLTAFFFAVALAFSLGYMYAGALQGVLQPAANAARGENAGTATIPPIGMVGLPGELKPLAGGSYTASVPIVAVTSAGKGVLNRGDVEIRSGQGRVLIDTNPFVEPDTQQSLEIAKSVAEKYTRMSLRSMDAIYSVSRTDAKLVGGPSAGAAFTVATIAAIEGKKIRDDAAITGTISPDGTIGQIGGVVEKLTAAAENGKRLFLVPRGQGTATYYEQRVQREQRGFITIERINYVPKTLDLNAFAQQWETEVREVGTIAEAVGLMVE